MIRRTLVCLLGAVGSTAATSALADAPAASPFATAKAVGDTALKSMTAREDLAQTVNARNTSNVANNSVGNDSTTGTITFDGQSFQGVRGLTVLSANTGNNVSINASLNVNVAIRQ